MLILASGTLNGSRGATAAVWSAVLMGTGAGTKAGGPWPLTPEEAAKMDKITRYLAISGFTSSRSFRLFDV
ncbi:hypothetical protein R80B4_02377 [Fibrobacteres bacterium R8-0-B4]